MPPGTKNKLEQETGQISLGGGGIKIPQLTDRDRYAVWRNQFCAVATVKGFAPALVKGFKSKFPSSHDATLAENNDGKAQKKALVMNDLAVAMLTLALNSTEDQNRIEESKSDEFPNGIAEDIMVSLDKDMKAGGTVTKADCQLALLELKLEKNEDPKQFSG